MNILFLSHYFPPEVNAPASRTFENTKRWVKSGHKVSVITCAPNHPNGILYPGYKNFLWQWDEKDGIDLLRVKTYLSANKGFLRRILNYVSFMISATLQCPKVKNVDIVVSTSPQFFCGLAGYIVSRLKRKPWVLEIRDLWPESIIAVGAIKKRWLINLLEQIETFLYVKADHIISLTEAFKLHIVERGVAPSKITVNTNGADLGQFTPMAKKNHFRNQHKLNEHFIVSYIGTHGMAHALESVLYAAEALKDRADITFLLVGDGAERDKLLAEKENHSLKNVIMLPQQEKEKVPEIIAASDVCMVLLRRTPVFKTVIPSKIFEALAMQRPIILGVEGESAEIVQQGNCGICIEPENAKQLAGAVLALYADADYRTALGKNGRILIERQYSRDVLAAKYIGLLNKLAG
jgi:glycosyltransferase involved in cell wall biosynthesis